MVEPDTICDAELRPLPKLAVYLFERKLKPFGVAGELQISREHARRICLPFDDPDHRKPNKALRQRVAHWTGGVVALSDWDAPIMGVLA